MAFLRDKLLLCQAIIAAVVLLSVFHQPLKAAEGRILNFSNSVEPESIEPGMATGIFESNIIRNLFDGLVGYDPKTTKPIPQAAERWSISADGLRYTFYIRKNATWSDGTPLTANDFDYSWKRLLNPKSASKYAFILYAIKNAKAYHQGEITNVNQVGVHATSAHVLTVTLENPSPFFLNLLGHHAYRAVPKWAIERHGGQWAQPKRIVTSGPFLLDSWVPHRELVIVKNPAYWDADQVKLAGVRFFPLEDKNTAVKKYRAGELDIVWDLPPLQIPALAKRADFYKTPFLGTYFYRLNVTRPPLNDKRVRQALAMAIDRQVIVNQFLQGQEIPNQSFVPIGLENYSYPKGLAFDPEGAKTLIREAGFINPAAFPRLTILYNTDEQHKLIAQVIQQQWRKNLGIEVALLNRDWKSYLDSRRQLHYDIARSAWIGDYPDPNTFLDTMLSDSSENQTGWHHETYDALIGQAAAELDPAKRLELLHEAEDLLLSEAPLIPIYTYTKKFLMNPEIDDFHPNILDIHPFRSVYFKSSTGGLWESIIGRF